MSVQHGTPSTPHQAMSVNTTHWRVGEDSLLECVQVRQETHDVKTFIFRADPLRRFHYQAGQFITLELNIAGETINRCYTLSSAPTRPERVSITVKRIPGGIVSNWLHEHLQPGMKLSVLGPAGDFTYAVRPHSPYLFLSAGSGITPLMSMSRTLSDLAAPVDIVFIHSARSPRDIIFRHELNHLASQNSGFSQKILCESHEGEAYWPGVTGRLNAHLLQQMVPDLAQRQIFCCGPSPYMASVRALLQECGFNMQQYHEESFNFAELFSNDAGGENSAASVQDGAGFKVKFSKMGDELVVSAEQTVLAAARAKGMRLPASCTKGVCGTCKTKLLEGKVDMQHGGGIRQREIDQGYILPCCSRPLTDLVLER